MYVGIVDICEELNFNEDNFFITLLIENITRENVCNMKVNDILIEILKSLN